MGQLRKMFKDVEVPEPVEMKRTKWGQDEFSGGAYSHVKLHSGANWKEITDKLHGALREPLVDSNGETRVWFAGEHTHEVCFSWVHGGFLSGQRAGEEMVAALGAKT